jgi:hypothetical protein
MILPPSIVHRVVKIHRTPIFLGNRLTPLPGILTILTEAVSVQDDSSLNRLLGLQARHTATLGSDLNTSQDQATILTETVTSDPVYNSLRLTAIHADHWRTLSLGLVVSFLDLHSEFLEPLFDALKLLLIGLANR